MLSELAVVGFEYGFAPAEPQALTVMGSAVRRLREQCQLIIDQFICSGERKWLRM